MKKSILSLLLMFIMVFPVISQVENTEDAEVPIEEITLKKDMIPAQVQQAVSKDFTYGEPVQWSNFPYLFKEYGWTAIKNEATTEKPDRYAVILKSKKGGNLYAVYSADGTLLRSREILKNGPLPKAVENALLNSEFKDWKVDADKELIQDYSKKVVKHYVVKVEKDNKKRLLYFDEQGNILKNKPKKK
jgi:hypothetical protein